MAKLLSKSGIGTVGDIPWGSRLCLFYRNSKELIDILVPYFRAGLENNEYCLMIAAAPLDHDSVLDVLSQSIPDFTDYIAKGQIGILSHNTWYLTDGSFDPVKTAVNREARLKQALQNGFSGLRKASFLGWLGKKDWPAFLELEASGDDSPEKSITLLAYSLDSLSAPEIIDVINSNRLIIFQNRGQWIVRGKQESDVHVTLSKRIKELHCLYEIARTSGRPDITLDERLIEIAKIIPQGFNHSHNVYSRISIEEGEFRSANYRDTKYKLKSDIYVHSIKSGSVEIGYLQFSPDADISFSKEEVYLIDAVAERLGRLIEHRRAEDALKESEEKFSKAFFDNPAMVTITTLEGGRFLELNDAFEQFTGYTREEANKLSTLDIGIWGSPQERIRMMHQLKTSGQIRDYKMSMRNKNGEIRYGIFNADLITVNGVTCVLAVTLDTTEQTHSQELIQSISQSLSMGIYVMQDKIIRYVNPQLQQITGYGSPELIGKSWLDFISPEDVDVVQSSIAYTLEKSSPYPCEYRVITRNGTPKWVMQTVGVIHYEGKPAVLGSIMDITERKYLERKVIEYEELDKLKTSFLSTISHELRTPLASIKGYSTMVLNYSKQLKKSETLEHVRSIDNSADKLIRLVDNLLDTSHLDASLFELETSPCAISQIIHAAVNDAVARDNRHRFITKVEKSLPKITIDASRIRRVLDNLIDNAIKYSPDNTEISISAHKDNNEIAIAVTDHGYGISRDDLSSIFERMSHLEKRKPSATDGIGLGLYVSQRLIEAHGGHIWAESTVGKGSTVQFTLPITPRLSMPAGKPAPSSAGKTEFKHL
jgi:PAS domain S-box-containing protein